MNANNSPPPRAGQEDNGITGVATGGGAMADAAAFKDKPFAERLEESTKVRERYPERVPVIITRSTSRGALSTPDLDRSRFLVPQE
jgi:hypothetical protein